MKEQQGRKEKRIHLTPLILGAYAVFLGLGLVAIGLAGFTEGIGFIRFLLGLGLTCLGLYGIWDGVRDLAKSDKKSKPSFPNQFILTDIVGNRSSNVSIERLREQLEHLMENRNDGSFHLQILPPFLIQDQEMLKQVSCIYREDEVILMAFFDNAQGRYRIAQKSMEPDIAEEWLKQCLSRSMDFTGWENARADVLKDGPHVHSEEREDFCYQLLKDQKGLLTYWHQLLVIFGESWHDEHKFFSSKDLELAIEGVHNGKYQKAVLEWGSEAFHIFPSMQNRLMVIWRANNTGKTGVRFLAREGTVNQVKFWLINYLDSGSFEEVSGWNDITDQVEKEWRKHGKVF